jgi:hypothetical protein
MPRIRVGSRVQYRLYNTPEQVFYGDIKEGQITEIISPTENATAKEKTYRVEHQYGSTILKRKEIKRVLS